MSETQFTRKSSPNAEILSAELMMKDSLPTVHTDFVNIWNPIQSNVFFTAPHFVLAVCKLIHILAINILILYEAIIKIRMYHYLQALALTATASDRSMWKTLISMTVVEKAMKRRQGVWAPSEVLLQNLAGSRRAEFAYPNRFSAHPGDISFAGGSTQNFCRGHWWSFAEKDTFMQWYPSKRTSNQRRS